jgi:hypothetical protein
VDKDVWPNVKGLRPENLLGFWSSYRAVTSALAGSDAGANAVVVRLAAVDDACISYFEPILEGEPAEEASSSIWAEPLGFDVADRSQISGLTNCAPVPPRSSELKREWRAHLNKHGLIEQYSAAIRFRDLCDREVPAHAPFCVYQLVRCKPVVDELCAPDIPPYLR